MSSHPTQRRHLSDPGSALAGSLGIAASANLNPERRFPSMFEHFGLNDEAKAIHRAIETTTANGTHSRDIGGTASTTEVTAAIIKHLLDN
ncbi:hypothetical protein Prum_071040 [Phytohabitans rumicis]|uniref:Uncharacterized protein n=2 Tax=Phytohabitans rumicis TaxID=1076125 RepID=A0A6V8L875_9ACTN|nr:hypothetical protein Prum_071040 [Phytohabitans rumicis]